MIDDIISSTNYNSADEIVEDANAGICGLSDDDAWAHDVYVGTIQWKIVKVPEQGSVKPYKKEESV